MIEMISPCLCIPWTLGAASLIQWEGMINVAGFFLIRQWVSSKYRSHSAFEEVCSMAYWCCAFCAFSAVFLHLLLTHINTSHNDEEQSFAYCRIDEGEARFRRANSLAKHVREKHRTYLYSCRENLMLQSTANGTGMSDLRCVQRIIKKVDRERAYSWIHLIRSRGKVRWHMLSSRGGGGWKMIWVGWVGERSKKYSVHCLIQ